jgi:glucosamine-phosphate N-acetyltransferase
MLDNFVIRRLEFDDYNSKFLTLLDQLTTVGNISQEQFNMRILNSGMVYVLLIEEKIVATATLCVDYKFIHNCGKVGRIEDVVVDNEYRSRGLGLKLINYLIDLAEKLNCYKVLLNCDADKVAFYEKCDMTENGVCMSIYL